MARQIRRKSGTVKAFLLQSQGIANPLMIQSLEKVRRNEVLMAAKGFGAGLRQLSRLTGVSFGVIQNLSDMGKMISRTDPVIRRSRGSHRYMAVGHGHKRQ